MVNQFPFAEKKWFFVRFSQKLASNDFRCSKEFDFLGTVSVRGEGGIENERSISDGCGI